MAGAPAGNQNARKAKDWESALRRALAQYEHAETKITPGEALGRIAKIVVEKALTGDKDAIAEIGNRLDGKPAQAITGDDGGPISIAATVNAAGLNNEQLRALASIPIQPS